MAARLLGRAGRRSSFHESLTAAWGLHEYARASGDSDAAYAANRAAELFLQHRLVYSLGTGRPSRRQPNPPPAGEVINGRWIKLGYPSYWHYDILAVLMFLARIGKVRDPAQPMGWTCSNADVAPDGPWAADRQWWTPPDGPESQQREVVDWGRPRQPNEMITLNALRILRAGGRGNHEVATR